jgi:predicted TIM-barrel fold metal-dependent hydrolase
MKYQDPVLLVDVGIKFRKLKVIVAHDGYFWVDQGICVVAKHPNFYADMTA